MKSTVPLRYDTVCGRLPEVGPKILETVHSFAPQSWTRKAGTLGGEGFTQIKFSQKVCSKREQWVE